MKTKTNAKDVNGGIFLLFLAGCLMFLLVGGYTLVIFYTNNTESKTPSSDQMQITNEKEKVSTAEDGATATVE